MKCDKESVGRNPVNVGWPPSPFRCGSGMNTLYNCWGDIYILFRSLIRMRQR